MDLDEFVDDQLARLTEMTEQLNKELDMHKAVIDSHDAKLLKLKKFSGFVSAGTIVSITLSILTTLLGYESISFASNILTVLCLVLMAIDLLIMTYHHNEISKRYSLMTKAMQASWDKEMEWAKSQMRS